MELNAGKTRVIQLFKSVQGNNQRKVGWNSVRTRTTVQQYKYLSTLVMEDMNCLQEIRKRIV